MSNEIKFYLWVAGLAAVAMIITGICAWLFPEWSKPSDRPRGVWRDSVLDEAMQEVLDH